jgi:DNA (cytosine-5)-methyltransferase 1
MRIGSLCSGAGALELGLCAALEIDPATSIAWHCENDKAAASVLEAHWPGVPNYSDITTIDWTEVESIDWLTAGYPCQPFSSAGRRQGSDDERHLWPFVATAIRVLRPRGVLLENVAGHLSLGFGVVLGDLATIGYDARWVCLPASGAGAPHRRERVFIHAAPANT